MTNLKFYLALNRIPRMGPKTVKKLLSRWPNLEELFSLSQSQLLALGLPNALAEPIAQFDWSLIEADLAWQTHKDCQVLSWDDPRYPALLKEIAAPPFILYAQGNLQALQAPTLAMVGSRNPTHQGQEHAFHFAAQLAKHGLTIVSGLALGIDGKAHEGCLHVQGSTIAVLGTGIDRIYPSQHQALAQRIMDKGLILTEFPLGSAPIAGHFPRRNRIISGLSLATLIVEAAIKSGSLITARYALEQNRDVLAIPGSINNPRVRGCHYLLQQGAKLVTSVEDVLEEFSLNTILASEINKPLPSQQEHNKLIQCVDEEMTTVDQITMRSGLDLQMILCALTDLELQGAIRSVPGGYIKVRHEREFY